MGIFAPAKSFRYPREWAFMGAVEEPKEGPIGLQLAIGIGIGVVLAAAVAGALTLARGRAAKDGAAASASASSAAGAPGATAKADGPTISLEPEAVTAIEITRAKEPTIKLERKDGAWRIVAPIEAPADADGVNGLLSGVKAWRLGAAVPPAEADKVFAEERVHLTLRKGDQSLEVSIGGENPVSPKLRVPGQPGTWEVASFPKALLTKDLVDYRDHALVRVDPAAVDHILIDNQHGSFELDKTPQGWKGARAASVATFDPARADELLVAIKSLDALGFGEEGADTGLDKPTIFGGQIKIFKKGSTDPITISFGKAAKGGRYVSVSERPGVFVASSWVADWAMADASKLSHK
jgi:hypothetical protein